MSGLGRLVVFGGTGRMGKLIARAAVERGYEVVCFGRSADAATVPPGAQAFRGDVSDEAAVRAALEGATAAVLALSIPRASASPFARVIGRKDLHSVSVRALVDVSAELGLRRVIKLSAQGVGDSAPRAGLGFRFLVRVSNLRVAFDDHARADQALQASSLDWTIVRPPILSDARGGEAIAADETLTTWTRTKVARADVATWIVDALEAPLWHQRCVTLAPSTAAVG